MDSIPECSPATVRLSGTVGQDRVCRYTKWRLGDDFKCDSCNQILFISGSMSAISVEVSATWPVLEGYCLVSGQYSGMQSVNSPFIRHGWAG